MYVKHCLQEQICSESTGSENYSSEDLWSPQKGWGNACGLKGSLCAQRCLVPARSLAACELAPAPWSRCQPELLVSPSIPLWCEAPVV